MTNDVDPRAGPVADGRGTLLPDVDVGAVRVREVSDGDIGRLRAMLARISPETSYMRFHMARVPEKAVEYLTNAEKHGGRALVAVVGERIVGHAMYVPDEDAGPAGAEVAVLVEDEWQTAGVGRLLLYRISKEAQSRGVETFTCASLGENRRVSLLVDAVFGDAEYEIKDSLRVVRAHLGSLKPMGGLR